MREYFTNTGGCLIGLLEVFSVEKKKLVVKKSSTTHTIIIRILRGDCLNMTSEEEIASHNLLWKVYYGLRLYNIKALS